MPRGDGEGAEAVPQREGQKGTGCGVRLDSGIKTLALATSISSARGGMGRKGIKRGRGGE